MLRKKWDDYVVVPPHYMYVCYVGESAVLCIPVAPHLLWLCMATIVPETEKKLLGRACSTGVFCASSVPVCAVVLPALLRASNA